MSTEWTFSTRLFQQIQSLSPWGPAVIDLFANSLNHRLLLYVSPCPYTQALAVNVHFTYYANAVTGTGLKEACENLSIPTNFCRLNPSMITGHVKR